MVYWLGASIFCTLIYALTAWRMPTEFFGYVTLAAWQHRPSARRVLHLPLEWHIAVMTALAAAMWRVRAGLRALRIGGANSRLRSGALPHLLLPLTQALVLFVPGNASLDR